MVASTENLIHRVCRFLYTTTYLRKIPVDFLPHLLITFKDNCRSRWSDTTYYF